MLKQEGELNYSEPANKILHRCSYKTEFLNHMRAIRFLWRKSSVRLVLAFLASIAGGVANVSLLVLLQRAIADKLKPNAVMVWVFVGLCLCVLAARVVSQLLLTHLSQQATFKLVMQLCRQIVATPLARLEQIGPARLQAALTDDVSILITGLVAIPTVLTQCTIVLLCLGYMVWLSSLIAAVVILFLMVCWTAVQVAMRRTKSFYELAWKDRNLLFGHFRSLIAGIKELKLHSGRKFAFLEQVVPSAAESYKSHNLTGTGIFNTGAAIAQLLMFVAMALVVFYLPHWVGAKSYVASGFMILLLYLIVPFEYLASALPTFGRADLALKQIESLQLAPLQEPWQRVGLSTRLHDREYLNLRGVTHKYFHDNHEGEFTLGPLDLSVRKGELIFLIGGNGSGKTTLAKILTGLYAPRDGQICFEGTTITEQNREVYRQNFSAVFQDFYLFENLLGLECAGLDERTRKYLALLQLDRKVTVTNGRLSTIQLSHGQRKRLALLVAYLEDRPIYLFDEWASDQDPLFKDFFYREMLPDLRQRGKTVFVISHDDHYYGSGTRLIKLVEGTIEYDRVPDACLPNTAELLVKSS